jgi:hypothetical protein
MAENNFKPRGQIKQSKPDAGGGVLRNLPVIGIVKNNIDDTHAGRIDVYVADFGGVDPDDSSNWTTINYMSPFFGSTPASAGSNSTDYGTYETNPSSYGMWFSPPDIGSKVVCIFINGDSNYGYYIGGILEPELLQMIPAIGSSDNIVPNKGEAEQTGGATKLPVSNLNTNNKSITDSQNFLNEAKPIHSFAAGVYQQQGLLRDPIRGPISSSALRESPSRVGWGVSTPGRPIFQGGYKDDNVLSSGSEGPSESLRVIARRGGHSIVMDDGDVDGKDQLIRLRTIQGHQILMSDDGQTLQIIHSNGQSYVELGTEGTVDVYAMNSVNVRTQGDLNLHADRNININAKKDLNIAADNININAATNIGWRAGGNFSGYTLGTYTIKVNGSMSMFGSGEGSYASGQTMFVNGSKINLNTGATSVTPAEVPLITQIAHTDTLNDPKVGFAAAPALLKSIVSRAPAHMPWANAGQGVDVSVSSSPSDSLPATESPAVETANNTTAAAPETPTNAALASTVPPVPAVSESIDSGVSSAMVSASAVEASATAPEVVASGTGVVTDAAGVTNAAVGKLAMTPQQMEAAMVIKPGAAALATSLVQGGANVATAMPSNMFTGKPGAENLNAFVQNTGAQVVAKAATLQQAQSALTSAGVITGKEAPGAIAGLVNSAATVGVAPTLDFVKNASGVTTSGAAALAAGSSGLGALADAAKGVPPAFTIPSAPGGLADALKGAGGNVASAISAGNFASNLSTNVTGGLGSISTSLAGLGPSAATGGAGAVASVKSLAASAFGAITKAFKPLSANVPQNLTAIAAKNSEDQAVAEEIAAMPASQIAAMQNLPGTNAPIASLGSVKAAAAGMSPQTSALLSSTITALASGGKGSVISGATAGLLKQGIGISQTLTSGKNLSSGQINSAIGSIASIGAATGGSGTRTAMQSASLIGASIGIGQALSSGKNLNSGQISTVIGALNTTQGKNGIPNSLITQSVGLAQSLASGKPLNQGQINGLVGSVAQIGSATSGGRINASTASLIAQSLGLAATVTTGNKVSPNQVSAVVTSGINAALRAGSPTNRSGVGALPGGLAAIAAVTIGSVATGTSVNGRAIQNTAINTVSSLPGLGAWGAVIKNASTAVMNNIPKPTAARSTVTSLSAGSLASAVNSQIPNGDVIAADNPTISNWQAAAEQAKSDATTSANAPTASLGSPPPQPISALATSGLPASQAAALTASINSMNAGGSSPIKLPTVSTGTVDRSQLTSQLSSMLGSNKIQMPNFSGVPPIPSTFNKLDSASTAEYDATAKELATLKDKRWDVSKAAGNARYKVTEAKQKLPQGDIQIVTLESASVVAQKDLEDIDAKIVALQRKQYTLATGQPYPGTEGTQA